MRQCTSRRYAWKGSNPTRQEPWSQGSFRFSTRLQVSMGPASPTSLIQFASCSGSRICSRLGLRIFRSSCTSKAKRELLRPLCPSSSITPTGLGVRSGTRTTAKSLLLDRFGFLFRNYFVIVSITMF